MNYIILYCKYCIQMKGCKMIKSINGTYLTNSNYGKILGSHHFPSVQTRIHDLHLLPSSKSSGRQNTRGQIYANPFSPNTLRIHTTNLFNIKQASFRAIFTEYIIMIIIIIYNHTNIHYAYIYNYIYTVYIYIYKYNYVLHIYIYYNYICIYTVYIYMLYPCVSCSCIYIYIHIYIHQIHTVSVHP